MSDWLLILTLCFVSYAGADPADDSRPPAGEPVVITVSAQELAASSVSASVTVISKEEIEQSKAEHVLDLLQAVPFLHISQTGGAGGLATVSLRGGDPNFTLVMIDGIPVNDPTNLLGGSFDFSFLSTDQIERIEIVRGPMSSMYGSEAISGVVHIISRKGQGAARVRFEGRGGNLGTREVRASAEGSHSLWHYAISGSYFDAEDGDVLDSLRRNTAAASASYDFSAEKALNLSARYTAGDASGFPDNGGGPLYSILKDAERTDSEETLFGAKYRQRHFAVDFDFFQHRNDSFTPAILDTNPPGFLSLPSFRNETDFERSRFQWTGFWNPGAWSVAAFGAWKKETGDRTGIVADLFPSDFQLRRNTVSGGGEALYRAKHLNVILGFRIDDSEKFSSEVSPRAGITWIIPDTNTRLRATWGEGYKLPSFFSLADTNIGNPDLLPERSRAWDFGIEHELASANVFLSATWFHNSFRDLIDFSPELFRLVNRRKVITQGVEFEGRLRQRPGLQWIAHVSYVDADIRDSSEPLRDRPKWRGGIGMDWSAMEKMQLHVRFTAIGDRFDFQIPVPDRSVAAGYQVLDLAGSYEVTDEIAAFLRIDNVLDRKYQEFIGFPNPGLSARAGVTVNLEL